MATIRPMVTLLFALGAIAVLVIGAEVLFERMFGVRLIRPDIRRVRVTGRVVDGKTQKPVADAHVVVWCQTTGIKSGNRCFALSADDEGAFVIDAQTEESLRPELSVLAAGRGDMYGG
jgi:hypothetical protein